MAGSSSAWTLLVVLAVYAAAVNALPRGLIDLDPDVSRNSSELIRSRGYPAEEYTFTTSDGYILRLFRIPHGINRARGGPPVIMVHALLCSSDEWLMDSPKSSLGYVLADAGFDVWIVNKRGNTYSNKHTSLTVDDDAFWDYTWDDVGQIDVPEQINFILQQTGYSTLGYVGHSEGTTVGFIAALQPSTQGKINAMVLLAPVANVTNVQDNKIFTALTTMGETAIYLTLGHQDFFSQSWLLRTGGPIFCKLCPSCCTGIIFAVCGQSGDTPNFNSSRFQVYYSHTPSGTSIKNMVHWVQGLSRHRFQMYDYGTTQNKLKYKQSTPPEFKIANIKAPIALFTGDLDSLSTPKTVDAILAQLPSTTLIHRESQYEHMDFTWGIDAHTKIYPGVVSFLQSVLPAQSSESLSNGTKPNTNNGYWENNLQGTASALSSSIFLLVALLLTLFHFQFS